ncbi:MAG TPA: hydrogenase [Verrucomicrobia bacterium]|nr:MAG: hydrogenase [Lentisphaerae bacterium GWF2_57_35]HBA86208.1 hydrogenase [Verrucomicrobiota bacterium]
MIKITLARLHQKHRTIRYPDAPPPPLPDRLRGRPLFDAARCQGSCQLCAESCPTGAIEFTADHKPRVDLGKCLFCNDCVQACPQHAIRHSNDYRLAASRREELVVEEGQALQWAHELGKDLKRLLGRSLKLRQVSAGGCNACEADVNVLGTVGWDLGRFGIQFVASPRHADGVLITGPVTQNMQSALMDTYRAVPNPKIVIAVGACAIAGGPFVDHAEVNNGVTNLLPVDLFIPGCPPHPLTILDGLLRLLGRVKD